MRRVKDWTALLATGTLAVWASTAALAQTSGKVGVSMPTHAGQR